MSDASYYLYKKQFSYDGTNWFDVQPLTYSYDGDGTMQPVVNTYHDEDCKDNVDYSKQYLTIESLEDNNVIYIIAQRYNNDINPKTISASTDNGQSWAEYTSASGGTMLATLNTGDKLLLKGENASYAVGSRYNNFYVTKQYNVYGNIMSLVSGDTFEDADTLTENYTFWSMFTGSTTLVSAENLILPATTLTNYCYGYMFNGCTSLIATPKLPALNMARNCYSCMFQSCRNLTTAPELPALNMANNCYQSMFGACTSLVSAPELPATTLATQCYAYMFRACTSLNYIKCLATDISATECLSDWVSNVSSTGTFVKNAAMNDWTTGTSGIPSGWTVQNA